MGLCLFANNNVINHAENQIIDHNKKPTAVYLAGVMRKGENEVGLLGFYKNIKFCTPTVLCVWSLSCSVMFWFFCGHIAFFKMTFGETVVRGLLSTWKSGDKRSVRLGKRGTAI